MKRVTKMLLCVFLLTLVVGMAYAQFARPDDAIRYRKAVMVLIAQHFGRIGAVVKGERAYDATEVTQNARLIQTLSALPWEAAMTPGSDKGDTTLKASALKDQGKFMTAADAFEDEAATLTNAAESGDLNEVKAQFGAVAQSCKNCHKQFRK
jgi:cytochrome c556